MVFHMGFVGASNWGMVGVNLFFVLSGFLITSLLLKEVRETGRISLSSFWARRACRLVPGLLLFLGVVALAPLALGHPAAPVSAFVGGLFFVANWLYPYQEMGFLAHLWSLGVEEQFYVFWPLVLLLLLPRGLRGVRVGALALMGISLASLWAQFPLDAYGFEWLHGGQAWLAGREALPPHLGTGRTYAGTDTRLYALAAGIVAATLPPLSRPWVGTLGGVVLALILLVPGPTHGAWEQLVLGPLAALAGAALIASAHPARWLSSRPLQYVGRRSYGLYLWSAPLVYFATPNQGLASAGLLLLITGLIFLIAEASWKGVERPVLAWGQRRRIDRASGKA